MLLSVGNFLPFFSSVVDKQREQGAYFEQKSTQFSELGIKYLLQTTTNASCEALLPFFQFVFTISVFVGSYLKKKGPLMGQIFCKPEKEFFIACN